MAVNMAETASKRKTEMRYDPRSLDARWQGRWAEDNLYEVRDDDPRPKWYELTMYPYPSGDLHIGHWYAMSGADAHARFMRMRGYNVLHPMGFDAFGLNAENAAIERGVHPAKWTMGNIDKMRRQFRSMGAVYDWDRELVTCVPEYYRWNQWIFLQFLKAGLAYRDFAPANWCPTDNTVLANEQVVDGRCERCDSEVVRRELNQWLFRVTKYADELLDQSKIDWPEKINVMQTNWIGRSEGVDIEFDISEYGLDQTTLTTFTTRIDTIFGVTFVVLAPEHPLVDGLTTPEHRAEVETYVEQARRQTEIERMSTEKVKTGVFTGSYAVNRLNGDRVPILIGDYVLLTYGTGIVMGVPAHDQRDFEFAKKYDLPVKVVVAPADWDGGELTEAYVDEGAQVSSGQFDGLPSVEAKQSIADFIESQGWGSRAVQYRMRDWLISRQRYWGTPIPVVYCDDCGAVPVPEDDLPVLLPEDSEFRPTGESPLALHEEFVNAPCPRCEGPAKRETDTMDTFVDSSWYQFRFASPRFDGAIFDREAVSMWAPVDQYTGGVEHAVMHLLYARFFTKAMRDPRSAGLRRAVRPPVQPGAHPVRRREDEQVARQRRRARRVRPQVRRRRRPLLPDVHRPLGPGRKLERVGHQRRLPMAEPPLGAGAARPGRARRGPGRRGRHRRPEKERPQDDKASCQRPRPLQVQHGHRVADGAVEHHERRLGRRGNHVLRVA